MEALESAAREVRRRLILTPRWTELRPHVGQSNYFWHPARFRIVPPGRRSGKTELAKRKGVMELTRRRAWPTKILFGAPSWGQAKDIFWQDLKDLVPRHWVARISETELELVTRWGASLRIMGFDRPRRMEGVPWDWVFIDEIADAPKGAFHMNVRPALATVGREGRCDLLGVPDESGRNQQEYEELFLLGMRWQPNPQACRADSGDPDTCSFHWPSRDIISPSEIAQMQATMDELAFEQELCGRFVSSGGKAVPRFDTTTHVNENYCTYEPRLPLDWSLDFGTAPAASLVCQTYHGQVWVMDEIVIKDSSTDVAASEFLKRARSRGWNLRKMRIFGDAAGRSPHSNIGKSDYEILEEALGDVGRQAEWLNLSVNPLVKDTLNAVRGRACTADRMVHLHVHPRCRHLIKDLKTASWPDGSNQLRQHHCLAALRYYCYSLFGGDGEGYGTAEMLINHGLTSGIKS